MARVHKPFYGPTALGLSRSECAELARTVADNATCNLMAQVISDLGGKYERAWIDAPHEITLEVFGDADFRIYTSHMLNFKRANYNAAVALGHYVIHYPQVSEQFPGAGMQVPIDPDHPHHPDKNATHEAMWFATELTMPEAKLREVVSQNGPVFAEQCFAVPGKYIETRIRNLGLSEEPEVEAPAPR